MNEYVAAIREKLASERAAEGAHRPALVTLLERLRPDATAVNEPSRVACGAPDIAVIRTGVAIGYVECKDVDTDLKRTEKSEQLKRYREALPNLVLTDYLEFRWYVEGKLRKEARLGSLADERTLKTTHEGTESVLELLREFLQHETPEVGTAKELAQPLASLARMIRHAPLEVLAAEGGVNGGTPGPGVSEVEDNSTTAAHARAARATTTATAAHARAGRATTHSTHARAARATATEWPDWRAEVRVRQGAYLPHWTREGGTYAVTFRLHDSLPQHVLDEWRAERDEIIRQAADSDRALSPALEQRLAELQSERIEAYLDAGHGACYLRNPRVAEMVQEALLHLDGERYELVAWCLMPNHVHLVVRPLPGHELDEIMQSRKSYTAHAANRLLGRTGPFWQTEYYDHLIRDEGEFEHAIGYVLSNPAKAGLEPWPWCGVAGGTPGSGVNGGTPGPGVSEVEDNSTTAAHARAARATTTATAAHARAGRELLWQS